MTNLQEIFNKAYIGLLTQQKRCEFDGACKYAYAGKHCAIGFAIPYGHPAMDFGGAVTYLVREFPDLFDCNTEVLFELQVIHDVQPIKSWKSELELFANKYNLTIPEVLYN